MSSILSNNYLKKTSIPKADITTKASKICERESEMCSRFRRIAFEYLFIFFWFAFSSAVVKVSRIWCILVST